MVDFSKLPSSRADNRPNDPVKIFERRPSGDTDVKDLWRGQADALEEWNRYRDKSDVLLSLNTGAGKTVVGLLIAQSLMNEGCENVLYVCSTNDLVMQTAREAKELGVACTTKMGRDFSNDLFEEGRAFCITNYAAIFNGRSTLMRRNRPQAIVFDDAHVAEGMIRDAYTLSIPAAKYRDLYEEITLLFEDHFTDLHIAERFRKAKATGLFEFVMAAPRGIVERANRLRDLLLKHGADEGDLSYAYSHLADHLNSCAVIFGDSKIEITPPFLPSRCHPAFGTGVRRVYLSATLQSQVEFVRAFGRKPEHVIAPNNDAGNGERLILDGREVQGGFGPSFAKQLTTSRKAVIAVPTYNMASRWSAIAEPPIREKFSDELDAFREANSGGFVLVSRSDGIDLPANTCRIMIMDGLPVGTSLLERLIAAYMPTTSTQNRRVASRIAQLFGRINRGRNDYGAFLIEGRDLAKWLRNDRNVALLPPLLQRQIVVGRTVVENMDEHNANEALNAVDAVLSRNEGWVKYYQSEVLGAELDQTEAQRTEDAEDTLVSAALAEAKYAAAMWSGGIDVARNALEKTIADVLQYDEYLAGWHQAWLGLTFDLNQDSEAADKMYDIARSRLPNTIPLTRRRRAGDESVKGEQLKPLTRALLDLTHTLHAPKFEKDFGVHKLRLNRIDDGTPKQAEDGVAWLGKLLGFVDTRPDETEGTGPDVVWEDPELRLVLAFELKTDKDKPASYRKDDIGQGHDHERYLEDTYPDHERLGLLFVGPEGDLTSSSNPSPTMGLCLTSTMAGLRDRYFALVQDLRQQEPLGRWAMAREEASKDDWTLRKLANDLRDKSF
ncbi:DEAD/DEAH box helicase family protein [Parvularcula dongshanensis]|uniref:Helicase ATP-binding domain-containing protein n=1 Tax=Parvularcula dongshanensis TaxID=1173995 RepID=A0A840I4K5_9PROT|nr:DEAD/DEAH box helicase family protein [Parvularcula dongshanensis]MBB4659265.1 hypothetical protein [Parvularcula dongshanensis]